MTVKDICPALQTNRDGVRGTGRAIVTMYTDAKFQIRKVITTLAEQYRSKEKDCESFKQEHNIRPVQ